MQVISTRFEGLYILQPRVFKDERGEFFESFQHEKLSEYLPENTSFLQDNHSISQKYVLRGLHLQKDPHAQIKIVRVVVGEALDVVVDARQGSKTFGEHFKIRLSAENKTQLLVPEGFAHGFVALEDNTEFVYKCNRLYNPSAEAGLAFNDPELDIDWEVSSDQLILSPKDLELHKFNIKDLGFHA